MLLRIALAVAILAGLGVAGVSQFKVKEKITTLASERDEYKTKMETAETNARDAKKKQKKAEEDLRSTKRDLDETNSKLETATSKASQQEKRADTLAKQLEKETGEKATAQQELAAWKATSLTPEKVQEVVDTLKKITLERDVYADEKTVFLNNNLKLQARLDKYEKPDQDPNMREGLKGKIVAVDPKWDFVVLDIGTEQGAVERGVLLVNRNGKYVAKLRLTGVQRNHSIANVIPDSRQMDVMEGDEVFY